MGSAEFKYFAREMNAGSRRSHSRSKESLGKGSSMLYRVSRLVVTLVLMFWLYPASSYPQGRGVVSVVYYPPWNVSKVPLHLAQETGLFEKNGLKVSLRNAGSNDNLLKAMANREGEFMWPVPIT